MANIKKKEKKNQKKEKNCDRSFFSPRIERISKIFIHYYIMYMHMIDNFSNYANILYSLLCTCLSDTYYKI